MRGGAQGEPLELARGGRYDEVGAVFGRKRPAVGFSLDVKDCGFHGLDNTNRVEPGEMLVWVAPDSASGIERAFRIVE